jgi:hypothetical protein
MRRRVGPLAAKTARDPAAILDGHIPAIDMSGGTAGTDALVYPNAQSTA